MGGQLAVGVVQLLHQPGGRGLPRRVGGVAVGVEIAHQLFPGAGDLGETGAGLDLEVGVITGEPLIERRPGRRLGSSRRRPAAQLGRDLPAVGRFGFPGALGETFADLAQAPAEQPAEPAGGAQAFPGGRGGGNDEGIVKIAAMLENNRSSNLSALPHLSSLSRRLLLALGLSLAVACASAPPAAEPAIAPAPPAVHAAHAGAGPAAANNYRVQVPNPIETRLLLTRYADGPYLDELAAVYAKAHGILAQKAGTPEQNAAAKLAVVLDIDETSLSNLKLSRLNDFTDYPTGPCDLEKGPCSVAEWFKRDLGTPIAPAVELARAAQQAGIALIFITGRKEDTREITAKNLAAAGYADWKELVLRPIGPSKGGAADYKAAERRRLTEAGYQILINIGDQQSDLDGGYAEHTLKLPNPFYYIP